MYKSSFFIVGQHAVIEALKNPKRKVLKIFLTEESKKNIHRKNPNKNILENVKVYFKSKKELDKYGSLGDFLSSKNNPDINSKVFKSVFCEPYKPKTVSVISGKKMSMVEDLKMRVKYAERNAIIDAKNDIKFENDRRVALLTERVNSLQEQLKRKNKNRNKNRNKNNNRNKNKGKTRNLLKPKDKPNKDGNNHWL